LVKGQARPTLEENICSNNKWYGIQIDSMNAYPVLLKNVCQGNLHGDTYPAGYIAPPTSTPTLTPTSLPDKMPLWSENFEDGKADKWNTYGKSEWKVIEVENGNKVYEGTGKKDYPQSWLTEPGKEWKDYAFESKVRILHGTVLICIRSSEDGGSDFYNTFLPADGTASLSKYIRARYTEIYKTSYRIQKDKWYKVRLEIISQKYRVYIDDELVASYTFDKDSFIEKGTIGYYMLGGDKIQIDDIKVWALNK
jgi:parallel beta-helix repeat protein